jgi:hypothetical protein
MLGMGCPYRHALPHITPDENTLTMDCAPLPRERVRSSTPSGLPARVPSVTFDPLARSGVTTPTLDAVPREDDAMHLDLSDEETRALLNLLVEAIENDRYQMSPRIRLMCTITSRVPKRAR